MSTSTKGGTEDGRNGLSESVDPAFEAVSKIASHLASIASGTNDKLVPSAQFQIDVRSVENRETILNQLVLEVCPSWVNPDAWLAWLQGGVSPFIPKTEKAGRQSENPAQTLQRKTKSVVTQEKKVAQAQRELEASQRALALAEDQLAYVKAYESAALHFQVVNELVQIMAPAFAMGPAWTIMRALTSYVSDDAADKATYMFFGEDKLDAIVDYRKIRVRDTREMFEALDLFAGVPDFEEAVRAAVLKVCKDFEPRREEVVSNGRRPRSERAMKTTAHPDAQSDADEVLEGLQVT